MDSVFILQKLVLIAVIFAITLGIAAYSTYIERKFAAFLQDRLGPDRAGPFGILQPLADGAKMLFKEEIIPTTSNNYLFILGPGIAMFTACLSSAVIPWGSELAIGRLRIPLQVANPDIGVLFVFAIVSFGVYGIMIGGWASNNKYSLLGAIRASSQMISYEIAMGLSLVAIIMMSNSLSLADIANQQVGISHWNIWKQPLGFLIFLICAFAECNRAPFDLAECETELVGGYHTEYSSMKLGFYLFAEYINMFISSAIISTLYFGSYHLPFAEKLGLSGNLLTLAGTLFLFGKILFFILFFMWIRWTLPRFRYDQLMRVGWQVLIPLAIANILLTGLFLTLFK